MSIRELSELTWDAVAAQDAERTVAILPVGALEAHGPHLPLGTDVIIAEAMARAGAERLAEARYDVLLLPPLTYAPAPFAAGFAGTISIRPETLTALVVDIGRGLFAGTVGRLALANAHLDPAHVHALREAVATLQADGIPVVFPDITKRHLVQRLTEEFRSGACHAGCYETSIVLAAQPQLVDEATRSTLEPVPHSLSVAWREGKRTFEEVGGLRAYFGDPAAATAEEGAATIAELGRILAEAVLAQGAS